MGGEKVFIFLTNPYHFYRQIKYIVKIISFRRTIRLFGSRGSFLGGAAFRSGCLRLNKQRVTEVVLFVLHDIGERVFGGVFPHHEGMGRVLFDYLQAVQLCLQLDCLVFEPRGLFQLDCGRDGGLGGLVLGALGVGPCADPFQAHRLDGLF